MEAQLLRDIIEDCPVAYLKFRGLENKDVYNNIEIINMNKSCKELVNCKHDEAVELIIRSALANNNLNLNKILQCTLKNKKYTTIEHIKELNKSYKITIFSGENHEFHCRINELHLDTFHLSETLKNSPFVAWIKDRKGKYLDVNCSYSELVGKRYEDIIGKTDFEIWPDDLAHRFEIQDNDVLKNKNIEVYYEHLQVDKNHKKYFHTSKWPYVDDDNLVIGTTGITTEITDKVQIEETIRKNEEIFSELADNIDDIIFTRDENKILYISPSYEKIHGFNPEPLLKDIKEWFNLWDKFEFLNEPSGYAYKGITYDTYRVVKGDEEKWLKTKSIPIYDEYGNISKRIGITTDITKEKKVKDELEQLRLDFFANLSHELRTPINLVLSSLEVLKLKMNRLERDERDYFEKYLGIINQNGLRLLKLVNNLIDTTRIDSGHFSYDPKNYDIISFVENICMSVSDFVEQNNMSIVFDTNVEEKLLSFDSDNMERIILNLLSNAIKFNKQGGNIEVTINCQENITISIKDEGIGIPKDKIEDVFGRFEQVKNRTKKSAEGSGIGLSLVKSLVEMHNGNIVAKSELDKGSEFIIILPDVIRSFENNEEIIHTYDNIKMMKVEFSDIY